MLTLFEGASMACALQGKEILHYPDFVLPIRYSFAPCLRSSSATSFLANLTGEVGGVSL